MKKRTFSYILITVLTASLLLPGCGKKTASGPAETGSSGTESIQESTPETSVETIAPDDELPEDDPLSGVDMPYGEAENTYAGEIIETKSDAQDMAEGTAYPVPGDVTAADAFYTIQIDGMEVTEDRNEFETTEADAVVKIIYTVTNNTEEDGVLVGSMSFRLMDENNATFGEYFLNPEQDERAEPLPVEKGETGTFVIAYAITGTPSGLTLVFDDFFKSTGTQYTYRADEALIRQLRNP